MIKTNTIIRLFCSVAILTALVIAYPVQAADLTREELLTQDQVKDLTPNAQKAYAMMLDNLDMVLIPEAMSNLEEAADKDTRHIPLQFLCARSAISLARSGRGVSLSDNLEVSKSNVDLANEYYDIAAKCTQRILDTLNLPQELFDRADRLKKLIDRERAAVEVREERADYFSYQFLKEHVSEIYIEQKPARAQTAEDLLNFIAEQRAAEEEQDQNTQQSPSGYGPGGGRQPQMFR